MKLRWLGAFLALAFAAPATAHAQTSIGMANTLVAADFLIRLWQNRNGSWVLLSDFEAQFFFNQARCLCDEPVRITVQLTANGKSKAQALNRGVLSVLVGPVACVSADDAARSTATCISLAGDTNLVQLARIPQMVIDTTVGKLFAGNCNPTKRQEYIRIFLDVDRNQIPDLTSEAAPFRVIELDSEAPPAPVINDVGSGNEALQVSWGNLEGYEDFRGYVVFCSRGEDLAVFSPSGYDQQYHTQRTRCPTIDTGAQQFITSIAQEASGINPARGPFLAPGHFQALDAAYLCSDLIPSGTSHRITGLQNGIPYLVGVASVDRHGNASRINEVYLQVPIATRDFYSGYRAAGGSAEGGFCMLAPRTKRTAHWPWLALGGLSLWAMRRHARQRRTQKQGVPGRQETARAFCSAR